mgnify:CR=1 FL=1
MPGRHGRAHRAAAASAARRRTSSSATRSASPDCRSTATCCASRTASVSPKRDDPDVVEQQLCAAMPKEKWTVIVRHADPPRPPHLQAEARFARSAPSAKTAPVLRKVVHASPQAKAAKRTASASTTVTRERFEQLVEDALKEIPKRFRDEMRNVAVVVEDEPPRGCSTRWRSSTATRCSASIRARRCPSASWALRQQPAGSDLDLPGADRGSLRDRRRHPRLRAPRPCIHEFGHYFGMSEDEIEEIEEKFWRGRVGRGRCEAARDASASTFWRRRGPTRSSRAIDPRPDEHFLEIGPGPGALTLRLASRVDAPDGGSKSIAISPRRCGRSCPPNVDLRRRRHPRRRPGALTWRPVRCASPAICPTTSPSPILFSCSRRRGVSRLV